MLRELDEDIEYRIAAQEEIGRRRAEAIRQAEYKAKGHGMYREVVEKEFLPEVTSSHHVVCHFYHNDFRRCKILDSHLEKLAPRHPEAKFIKLDVTKAPFFVEKLKIQVLPTTICFRDGVTEDRIQGFDGVGKGTDEFTLEDLERRLGQIGVIATEETMRTGGVRFANGRIVTTAADSDSDDE
eukprot:JZ554625.1.p1 GENE.JZ554625.1~~JZ554625.1.p1  ORF type:complete len:183 (+),score=51.56 JZ554625.1:90-638(+)